MNALLLLSGALLGLVVGLAVGALAGRARARQAVAERDRLQADRDRLSVELADSRTEITRLQTHLQLERTATDEKLAMLQDTEQRFTERMRALSGQALADNARQFLELADSRFRETEARAAGELDRRRLAVEQLVNPLRDTLVRMETQLADAERSRTQAQAALTREVEMVRRSSEQLRTETAALVTALRKPQARGQWGEMQLRRVVECAGMVGHCDFDVQSTMTGDDGAARPDMVVHLAGGKQVVVDAKVPLVAFLEAYEAADDATRAARLTAHARQLRAHVDGLAGKSYWDRLPASPEFVVLFVPGEAFLAEALHADPTLIEYAAGRRVVLATPTTLIALLRTVAYAWSQDALAAHAREVFQLGRELYTRLGILGRHVDKLGRSLGGAVGAYNEAVGSLETRVLVTARRLHDLHVVDEELTGPARVDAPVRALAAVELAGLDGGGEVLVLPSSTGQTGQPGTERRGGTGAAVGG